MKTYTTDTLPNTVTAFLHDYSLVYRVALADTVNQRLVGETDKAKLNTYLQQAHGINKRHANAVITEADGMIASAKECRVNHIKQLEGKLKSAKDWLRKVEKKLKNARKFYRKVHWAGSKVGCQLPIACSRESRRTNWQNLRFQIHHKKRYISHLERKIAALKIAPIRVTIPSQAGAYFVGSKGESFGNQICQFDGKRLSIRVPKCLETKYGEYIECDLQAFPYGQDRIEQALAITGATVKKDGKVEPIRYGMAITYRFYAKDYRWFMAVSFDLPAAKRVTRPRQYGCLGIDINPNSIGFALVNPDGNLVTHGQINFDVSSKQRGQTLAIIADAVNQLIILALSYSVPIVVE